jgi:hypothetical protein
MYALRIYGNIELQLNGQGISKDRIHILTPGSSLRNSRVKPIYYSDIIGVSWLIAQKHVFRLKQKTLNTNLKVVN